MPEARTVTCLWQPLLPCPPRTPRCQTGRRADILYVQGTLPGLTGKRSQAKTVSASRNVQGLWGTRTCGREGHCQRGGGNDKVVVSGGMEQVVVLRCARRSLETGHIQGRLRGSLIKMNLGGWGFQGDQEGGL